MKNILKVYKPVPVPVPTYEGTEAFLKGRKPGFDQYRLLKR